MRLYDPFRLNDWNIRDFLILVFSMQFAVIFITLLLMLGIDIPVLRQTIGFVYLTFIPGTLLLRIIRVHDLGRIETILYSVGLSIGFLMFLGLLMNILYPIIGVDKPISSLPMLSTISAAVIALCSVAYARDKTFSNAPILDTKEFSLWASIGLCMLPLLSVFGTYVMNFQNNNAILITLLVVISLVSVLAVFHRFPRNLYPLVIFVVALSLLYHNSLISTYLTGWDIQSEYYFSSLVKANSFWTSSLPSDVNAMLSIVILAPVFSVVSNLSIVWVFKIIYPLLFSLVPLGLYYVFRKYTDERIAFLSCFFFVSVFTFYNEMPALARQEIAELFQVLLMLLLIDRNMKLFKKAVLGIVFAFSLVVSHYGLSYIFMFSLIVVWLVLLLRRRQQSVKGIVNSNAFVLLYCIFVFVWYVYISSASSFTHIVAIGNRIISSISEFANPTTTQGLNIITKTATSPLYDVTKILYLTAEFFIAVGLLAVLLRRTKIRFEREYVMFSLVNFALLIGGITVPNLASSIGSSRLFQVALIFLAPFCIIGGKFLWDTLTNMFGRFQKPKIDFLKISSIFVAIFLLFSSGLIYEIARDRPSSISLSNSVTDFPRFNAEEVTAAEWLKDRGSIIIPAYSDVYRGLLLQGMRESTYYFRGSEQEPVQIVSIPDTAYFFLGNRNVIDQKIAVSSSAIYVVDLQNLTFCQRLLSSNGIYDNGESNVFLTPGN